MEFLTASLIKINWAPMFDVVDSAILPIKTSQSSISFTAY